jgi:hypothetical protein
MRTMQRPRIRGLENGKPRRTGDEGCNKEIADNDNTILVKPLFAKCHKFFLVQAAADVEVVSNHQLLDLLRRRRLDDTWDSLSDLFQCGKREMTFVTLEMHTHQMHIVHAERKEPKYLEMKRGRRESQFLQVYSPVRILVSFFEPLLCEASKRIAFNEFCSTNSHGCDAAIDQACVGGELMTKPRWFLRHKCRVCVLV